MTRDTILRMPYSKLFYHPETGNEITPFEYIEASFPNVMCTSEFDYFRMEFVVLVYDKTTKSIEYKRAYQSYELDGASIIDIVQDIIDVLKRHYNVDKHSEHTSAGEEKHAHYCESCGAPLQKGSAVCVYCGTEIY